MTCEHDGENCNGAEFCNTCQVQIFSGYKYGDERYCNDHEPEMWNTEIAEMTQEEFDNQGEMYTTEWTLDDIQCDCPVDCPCRPAPEALQALYDADRARSKAENDAINAWQGERIEDEDGASYWDITHHPDGTVTAKPKASPFRQEMSWCELCNDERLEEDLNEDGLCPLCEEREKREQKSEQEREEEQERQNEREYERKHAKEWSSE